MALNKTHYLEDLILQAILQNHSFAVGSCYLALFTVAPTKAGGGTEVAGGSTLYVRQLLVPVAPAGVLTETQNASGSLATFAEVDYPTAGGAGFGTVVAAAIMDASSAGHMLYYASVTSVTIGSGVTYKFNAGDITLLEG